MPGDIMRPDIREAKLPVWAKDLLENARRRVKDAEAAAREARLDTDPANSSMIIDPHAEIPVGLGDRPIVRAVLKRDKDGEPLDWIDFRPGRYDREAMEVMASSTLTITPQVTNVIHLRIGPR
jgi:hypothetical protein